MCIIATDQQDPFSPERRYEQNYPDMAHVLPTFLQGYEKNRQSALAVLAFLDERVEINEGMKLAITALCQTDP
ncbi:MAG: hypothetical protein M5U34_25905 [Chloroflexi bacterium]|nr:hypothetical protein [Chloroflexota bacterium]